MIFGVEVNRLMSNSYTRLKSGDWAVRAEGVIKEGARITVTKKSGETKQETVSKVLWSGLDNRTNKPISLCLVAKESRGRRGNHAPYGQSCPYCGSRSCSRAWDEGALCDED